MEEELSSMIIITYSGGRARCPLSHLWRTERPLTLRLLTLSLAKLGLRELLGLPVCCSSSSPCATPVTLPFFLHTLDRYPHGVRSCVQLWIHEDGTNLKEKICKFWQKYIKGSPTKFVVNVRYFMTEKRTKTSWTSTKSHESWYDLWPLYRVTKNVVAQKDEDDR